MAYSNCSRLGGFSLLQG